MSQRPAPFLNCIFLRCVVFAYRRISLGLKDSIIERQHSAECVNSLSGVATRKQSQYILDILKAFPFPYLSCKTRLVPTTAIHIKFYLINRDSSIYFS